MSFWDVEDIIDQLIDQLFLREADENGVHSGRLSKFIELALVSRRFLNPVRRNAYANLWIQGPEELLLLTGQLHVSPHLAKFVKHARLYSDCSGFYRFSERNSRSVSSSALKCFLDACPQLDSLVIDGGNYLVALSSLEIVQSAGQLKNIALRRCSNCGRMSLARCTVHLRRGWLDNILYLSSARRLRRQRLCARWARGSGLWDSRIFFRLISETI
ncbi:hypothetical protein FB451DRAFT_485685 [Mycena latifolia]|nr:hypothetical protein FB451DRAFT_485685 [Mycena latifolia]